jgi:signal transduction histidine kinase
MQTLINIMAEVDRLGRRLRELLEFVRPTGCRREWLDLNELAERTFAMAALPMAKARVSGETQLGSDLPSIRGDAMLIKEVLHSLIGNAIDATSGRGGAVILRTGTERATTGRPQVFVEVRDTGPGITPEAVGKIFEPFYTTKAQGTGLGLAIARKFTEAHGGIITVESRPGEGATFRVTLPADAEA